ncbi:MAG: molybdate ABC transporter substrate-binding protein [Deltaproteobacteria bacterium]|nr:molybdate ABC transporter substrate-binding protein [Deltaproteobacteria bacterium]
MARVVPVLATALLLCILACAKQAEDATLTVATATSLRHVMPRLLRTFEQRGGGSVRFTVGASGDLRKQVEGGAPIDAVLMASSTPVDRLMSSGHVDPGTRRVVAKNQLILIGPKGGPSVGFRDLDRLGADARVAIGDPGAVPAGEYARQALQALGKWDSLAGKLVFAGDVSQVLALVRRGEVTAAVVYRTEIKGLPDIVVLDEAQGEWSPTPVIVGAVVRGEGAQGAPRAERARKFLDFLSGAEGRAILLEHGFLPP